jgi:hypothetical protein
MLNDCTRSRDRRWSTGSDHHIICSAPSTVEPELTHKRQSHKNNHVFHTCSASMRKHGGRQTSGHASGCQYLIICRQRIMRTAVSNIMRHG